MAQAARLNLRMQKEIKLLVTDPPPGVSFPFLSSEDSSSSSWASIEARLSGPEGTVYCEGFFTLMIQIPERYPFQPPNVTFATPIYHPNIDNGGRICLDILNLPPKGAWQPSLNISTVLTSIGLLLTEPNPDDGLMAEASSEYKYNRKVFDEKARYWTQRYANPVTAEKEIVDSILPNLKMEAKQPSSLAILPPSEVATADVHSGKSVAETEGSRKKLRLMSGRLSLKSAIPAQKSSTESQENMEQNHAQSIADGMIKDGDDKVMTCKEQEFLQGDHEEMLKENCNAVEEFPVDMRTVIVADSEESDEEVVRPYRSRHSLLQKRSVSKF